MAHFWGKGALSPLKKVGKRTSEISILDVKYISSVLQNQISRKKSFTIPEIKFPQHIYFR